MYKYLYKYICIVKIYLFRGLLFNKVRMSHWNLLWRLGVRNLYELLLRHDDWKLLLNWNVLLINRLLSVYIRGRSSRFLIILGLIISGVFKDERFE